MHPSSIHSHVYIYQHLLLKLIFILCTLRTANEESKCGQILIYFSTNFLFLFYLPTKGIYAFLLLRLIFEMGLFGMEKKEEQEENFGCDK